MAKLIKMIWDWKTGTKLYPEVEIQINAYAEAEGEESGKKAQYGRAVNISKQKPHFPVTEKTFKLSKHGLNKFLKLRANFSRAIEEAMNEEITITKTPSNT